MEKISLSEHLQILLDPENKLNLKEDSHTQIVAYKTFCRTLKINERNAGGDKIFKKLFDKNMNLKSAFAKKYGREEAFIRMIDIYKYQYDFFESRYKRTRKKYEELLSERYEGSEGLRVREELIHKNVIGNKIMGKLQPDPFLEEIEDKWEEFLYNYFRCLEAILDPIFYNTRGEEWKTIFDFEKDYYKKVKENKKPLYDIVASRNAYKNLYMYSRNCYIKNFYVAELPNMNLFSEIQKYEYSIEKEIYSLKDIALIYRNMIGLPDNETENIKQYERIKKVFQGKKYMEQFKKDGIYFIFQKNLSTVLSAYIFFRKKNNKENEYEQEELDKIIRCGYARILDILVYRKECDVKDFIRFYKNEFNEIFGSLNNDYQDTMIECLLTSTERLFYRYTISDKMASKEAAYGIRDIK